MIETILSWPHWSDALGLLGVLLLGVPALAASRSASVAHRVEHGPHGPGVDKRLRDAQRRLVSELWDRARRWSPVHGYCLWAGCSLTVLSFVVRFASQSAEPPEPWWSCRTGEPPMNSDICASMPEAAIRAGAQLIVTLNLRDFPVEALGGCDIEAAHPDPFVEQRMEPHGAAPDDIIGRCCLLPGKATTHGLGGSLAVSRNAP